MLSRRSSRPPTRRCLSPDRSPPLFDFSPDRSSPLSDLKPPFRNGKAIKKILYATDDDATVVAEAQAMVSHHLKEAEPLSPIVEVKKRVQKLRRGKLLLMLILMLLESQHCLQGKGFLILLMFTAMDQLL
ncbi:hypothetical protein FEM48_Zijuj09G0129600 [Ziziphus jujuba var. spinosa]|uniref:Uncharacterized protein n=1 Tax=Ziziphus jujuba var. spinosa TaxID=714518 RepID=A0A978UT52_ZIZJJ|nr:hypothetical protein FEM48_Zijuj09G0129600 [Ziziphus jujuba var. spinosa]